MPTNPRTYGEPPYRVALVHGGPGAGGEMRPVALRLCARRGILEPIQTASTVRGQVEELADLLRKSADPPVTLAGYSWGAWLSCLVAAENPTLVAKLVLVSSGPFDASYVPQLARTRSERLTPADREEQARILSVLEGDTPGDQTSMLARLGALAGRTDALEPIEDDCEPDPDPVPLRGDLYHSVWTEAGEMRRSGRLLEIVRTIACPVIAIHGDYDPHPAAGVRDPLAACLPDFRYILLPRCGHTPWHERQAREGRHQCIPSDTQALVGVGSQRRGLP